MEAWKLFVVALTAIASISGEAASPSALQASRLQGSLDAIFNDPILARALVGVRIERLADPRADVTAAVLYERDSSKLVMPASNMKLVTLAVAADRLGWDYRFETRLIAAGTIDHGTLHGDLIVLGSGDPSIVSQDFEPAPLFTEWAEALRRAGIARVDGRLVGDDSAFDDEAPGRGWAWDDLDAAYAAPAAALSYNENAVVIRVWPDAMAGRAPRISLTPDGHGLVVRVTVTTGPANSPARVTIGRAPGTNTLTIDGSVPAGGPVVTRSATVPDPAMFLLSGFQDALAAHGIVVRDGVATLRTSPAPPETLERRTIATRESMPLSALAGYFMKVSQNFYAETLLKTIGRVAGHAGSAAEGRAVVRDTVAGWGIAPDAIVMADGSGLSRDDYVTADTIVAILRHAWADERLRGPFVASLPVGGRDGTLDTRMRGTVLDGRVEAKTGTIANVRALSGYLETTSGARIVFSIIANNFTAPAAQIDRLVEAALATVAAQ